MKLHVLSDLHAEFAPFDPPETGADVVVLAGDVSTGVRGIDLIRGWFPDRPVIYLAGNHEYYRESIPRHTEKLREAARDAGIHFLENDAVEIGGVRFLGCTLWTDFELYGSWMTDALAAQQAMNDFRLIRTDPDSRRFRPADARAMHQRSLRWLREMVETPFDGPTVVVTHHAPSMLSVRPIFRRDPVTAAYASNLEWMLDGAAIPLWIHGHTHLSVDYTIDGTRVYANQRGYPNEPAPGFDPARTIDVPGT